MIILTFEPQSRLLLGDREYTTAMVFAPLPHGYRVRDPWISSQSAVFVCSHPLPVYTVAAAAPSIHFDYAHRRRTACTGSGPRFNTDTVHTAGICFLLLFSVSLHIGFVPGYQTYRAIIYFCKYLNCVARGRHTCIENLNYEYYE